jgi:hypothetical protein
MFARFGFFFFFWFFLSTKDCGLQHEFALRVKKFFFEEDSIKRGMHGYLSW